MKDRSEAAELPPDDVECVGRYGHPSRAHDHGLVVLAMGLSYWLIPEEGSYALYVKEKHAGAVRAQIERYEEDNRMWPPREEVLPQGRGSSSSLVLYVAVLWSFFVGADRAIVEQGLLSNAFWEGEWWRPVTALTLHGDWAHLMGNTVAGIFFMLLVFRFAGYGLGWFAVVMAGVIGNILNIWILGGAGHRSIGASTAVFGALGLVVGFRLLQAQRTGGWRWPRRLWPPVIGGLILLGMLGAGGERTDVTAHFWGFLAGSAIGAALGYFEMDRKVQSLPHRFFAGATLFLVAVAWFGALANR